MAYASSGLTLLMNGVGSTPSLWTYTNTDAHGTVAGAGYFTDAANRGMKIHDVVIVVDTDSTTCTIHAVNVSNITSINAATLA